MLRLYKCCVQPFFERFVLFFCLKIERFVPETAEIWICGLYVQEAGQKEIIGIRKYQPSAFGSGKSAITGITGSSALFGKENLHIRPVTARKMSKVHNIRRTVIICHDNLHIVPGRNGIETPLQQARYVLMGNND